MKYLQLNSVSLKAFGERITEDVRFHLSRRQAKATLKKIRGLKASQTVDSSVLKTIKAYSKKQFGSSSYWPWLAVYTEVRGRFMPGWIPQDYYRFVLLKKYNPELAMQVSATKTLDHHFFPDFSLRPVLIKIAGNLYSPEGELLNQREIDQLLYKQNGELVIKEAGGWQGKQISFTTVQKFKISSLSPIKNYVIQQALRQHEVLNNLHPQSVNTIRVYTYLNPDGYPEKKFAALRFGIGGTRVDNTSSGGRYCFIDSGGNCEHHSYDGLGFKKGTEHPDTGVRYRDIQIPNYSGVIEKCLHSHKKFPYARFIAWDAAINRDGTPVLIEWNTKEPGVWLSEALKGPLWTSVPD